VPGGKWPSRRQWLQLFKILPFRQRWLVRGLASVIIVSIVLLAINFVLGHTYLQPKVGGDYKEGLIGQPRYINPVLSSTNDADRDLVQFIYSSLFKYDNQGKLIPDLAESYVIEDDGLNYNILLKKDVLWHDGQPLTANDVIFTVKTIQNPEYRSPLRNIWQNVEVEKIDDYQLLFKIKTVYAPFLHNLTFGILPRHIWADIPAANFPLAEYNLKPIGSGPYQFKNFSKTAKNGKIESIELARNENYYLTAADEPTGPFIKKIVLCFYNNEDALIEAHQKRQIDGLASISRSNLSHLKNNLVLHQIKLPLYYAVFFNQTQSKALTDKTVRLALAYTTDKQALLEQVLNNKGIIVNSPLLPGCLGYAEEIKIYDFALEHANNILEEAGWTDQDEDGIREKEIKDELTKLEITLVASDWPEIKQTAELLKGQWGKIGAQINLEIIDSTTLQEDYLRPRQYDALLFGQALAADPDPFAFWHSSQSKDPGLNLALYQNKDVDKLLEEARQNLDEEKRAGQYVEFQKLLVDDLPAVFLFSPDYLYPVDKKVKGISEIEKLPTHTQRFSQIENWYVKTKRLWR
jgi:peptide/nickel transport system substrate-binding protein